MYLLFFLAMAVFAYGLHRRIAFWRRGKADHERLGDWSKRAWVLVRELLFQKRVRDSRIPGLFHSLVFYSFIILFVTTAVVALDYDFHTHLFKQNLGNPFGPQTDRIDWIEQLGIRVVEPGERCRVIYWIGCCTTFDPTEQSIAESLCTLLSRCGIEFGVLGSSERCCGDPARVLGDENLFQEIAKTQIDVIRQRDFDILLVSCPHCNNVLKHEYRAFGADFNVVHHSEFLHEMSWAGILEPRFGQARRTVYHDPCYLGRYQKIYDAPREVLKSIPGTEPCEMRDFRERSPCCGGGGGHFWIDLKSSERINNLRVQQAIEAEADTIVTGCAYCVQMLEDAVKIQDLDERLRVTDIATLVLESLPPNADRIDEEPIDSPQKVVA